MKDTLLNKLETKATESNDFPQHISQLMLKQTRIACIILNEVMHHIFELCLYLTIHSLLDVLEPPILDKQMRKAEDDLKKTEVNTKLLIQVTLSVLE